MEKALKRIARLQLLWLILASFWWSLLPKEEWEPQSPVIAADGKHAARLRRFTSDRLLVKYTSYEVEVTADFPNGEWRTAIEYVVDFDTASLFWRNSSHLQVVICQSCDNTQVADIVDGILISVVKLNGVKAPKLNTH